MFSSIIEPKQNKTPVFLKRNIFHSVVQNAILLYCQFLFIENHTFPSSILFPINMDGSKRTTTHIANFSSSTKNKQKKQKRSNLITESLFSSNTSNRFEFIMTPTRGRTCGLRRRNGTITLP